MVGAHVGVDRTNVRFRDELKRHFYITPSSYVELVRVYCSMYKTNGQQFIDNKFVYNDDNDGEGGDDDDGDGDSGGDDGDNCITIDKLINYSKLDVPI